MSSGSKMEVDEPSSGSTSLMKRSSGAVYSEGSPKGGVRYPGSDDTADFESLSHEESIAECTFEQLIKKFRDTQYDVTVDTEELIHAKCKLLFQRDYDLAIVANNGITENYPKELLIPIAKKTPQENEKPITFDAELYTKLVQESRIARLRSRVLTPAILFDNKFICRSGTLTVWLSAMYEMATKTLRTAENVDASSSVYRSLTNAAWNMAELAYNSVQLLATPDFMDNLLVTDLKVMKHLNIEHICDLMVEYNKNYRQQINVSSTEKVHEIYKDMKVEELPFPGCEFFFCYKEAGRKPEGLVFDWSQTDVTRSLKLTDDRRRFFPKLDAQKWKEWDLIALTGNYLKIILSYIVTSTGGLDIHCISGWDRTPLFVSLVRLSLWADGLVHESLDAQEMAYLVVAYDWFLFGHNLKDRLRKGEEVMHFAFNFLKHIPSDDFSVTRMFKELPEEEKRGRTFPDFVPGRRAILLEVRDYVLDAYRRHIILRRETKAH